MSSTGDHNKHDRHRLAAFLRERRQVIPVDATMLGTHARAVDRIDKPITQQEAADAISVSRTWYALLEEGGAKASPALLARICVAFSLGKDECLTLFTLAIPELSAVLKPSPLTDSPAWLPPDISRNTLPVIHPDQIDQFERRLAHLREKFFNGQLEATGELRPRILNSWMRCRSANVTPNTQRPTYGPGVTLSDLRKASECLLKSAEPVLASLDRQLAESGNVVVIANGDGVILDMRGGDEAQCRLYQDEPHRGGDASEAAIGTSAIGTSLVDGRPIQLLGAEHYSDGLQSFCGTAAPIRCPATLHFAGTLCVAGDYRLVRPYLLGLVVQSALEIEERLAALTFVA